MMIKNHTIEKQLAEILTDCEWFVFENQDEVFEYAFSKADDYDLSTNGFIRDSDYDEMMEAIESKGYTILDKDEDLLIFDKRLETTLTEMYNQYNIKGSIDKDLLETLFQETIQRNL